MTEDLSLCFISVVLAAFSVRLFVKKNCLLACYFLLQSLYISLDVEYIHAVDISRTANLANYVCVRNTLFPPAIHTTGSKTRFTVVYQNITSCCSCLTSLSEQKHNIQLYNALELILLFRHYNQSQHSSYIMLLNIIIICECLFIHILLKHQNPEK